MYSQVRLAADGAEEGKFAIDIKNTNHASVPQESFSLVSNGAATDANIGFGAASMTTIAGDLRVDGRDIYGPQDGPLNLRTDQWMSFYIDSDNDETMYFTWYGNGSAADDAMMYLGDDGILQLGGPSLTRSPELKIKDYVNDAGSGKLVFEKNRGTIGTQDGQDGDVIGDIQFHGYDAGTPTIHTYGR